MEPRYRLRLYMLTALILIGLGALVSRLYDYQIQQKARFLKQVPSNYTITIREPGIRGEITDCRGVVLAENLVNYEVVFNLEEIRDDYKRYLLETLGTDSVEKFREIKTSQIITDWVRPKLAAHNLDTNYNARALNTHYITHGGLVPFTFRNDLSYDQFAHFAEHNLELPGVDIRVSPIRHYPYGSLASHVLGYVKDWGKGDIPEEAKRKFRHYTGDSKGVTGVEATMNEFLTGEEGIKTLLKNEKGKVLKMVDYIKPDAGARVTLNIDSEVQYLVENTLRNVGRAAAVVMNPNTGEVIAMASVPDFTPAPNYSAQVWQRYNENKANPLLNKAIGNFTPGSTFKIPTAIAAAIHGHGQDHKNCPGYTIYGKIKIHCWIGHKGGQHGVLGVQEAIQRSCNPYFMNVANDIGSKNMLSTFQLLGLGKQTGIELPSESQGFVPGDRHWKLNPDNGPVTPAITGMMSIGQSQSAATPLQIATMASAIANGGKLYKPRIIKKITSASGQTLLENKPQLVVDLLEKGLKPADLENIRQGMWKAANENGGTAKRVALEGRDVAAKTGTAQIYDMGLRTNDAWTLAFAPMDKPKYVVVVAVKRGTSGGGVAGPLTHVILRGLFARDEGLQLNLEKMQEYEGDFLVRNEIVFPDASELIELRAEEIGETGNEIPDTIISTLEEPVLVTPQPTIRQEADAEGSTAPRAILLEE
ncbi:MAG: peptidoglycan D,D-transpeptidase FtsI family protein [Akkermansiaceae bacterium]